MQRPLPPTLSRRVLNRVTLARQLLLERADLPAYDAVAHLVGLQAQTPHSWYVGLWTRLANFRPEDAADLLISRRLVRIAVMRSTIHLVTDRDCLALRVLVQPVLDRDLYNNFTHKSRVQGLAMDELLAAGRTLLDEQPRTPTELGALLQQQWPERHAASLAYAVRNLLPLVQVPPRGIWGASGQPRHATAEHWLGQMLPAPAPHWLVRRYLAAFGPASVKDIQLWSGLTRLRAVVEELRPELVTFRDEHGGELFDLPDAPRPDPETPAPPRFIYDFDNLFLSHADRSRVVTDEYRRQTYPDNVQPSLILIDGFTSADWKLTRERDRTTLTIRPFIPLTAHDSAAITAEGAQLLTFIDPTAAQDIQITAPR